MTIRMIAEKCGCSAATVSKALNGAEDVSRETASRSYSFGVLFRDNADTGLAHEFFSGLLNGFKRQAEELGYDIFFISGRLGGRTIRYTEHARYRNCDGVFIANESYKKPEVRELADCGIPAVTIDYTYDGCASVQSDNYQGVRDLVRYIHGMGHRRIAFIHGEDTPVTDVRVASFRQTCRELGLDIPEAYVKRSTAIPPPARRPPGGCWPWRRPPPASCIPTTPPTSAEETKSTARVCGFRRTSPPPDTTAST